MSKAGRLVMVKKKEVGAEGGWISFMNNIFFFSSSFYLYNDC